MIIYNLKILIHKIHKVSKLFFIFELILNIDVVEAHETISEFRGKGVSITNYPRMGQNFDIYINFQPQKAPEEVNSWNFFESWISF